MCVFVCVSVGAGASVHTPKIKRLEQSTRRSVDVQCTAGAVHALTLRLKGQK